MEPEVLKMLTWAKNDNKKYLQHSVVPTPLVDTHSTEITQYKIMFLSIQNSACFDDWIKLTTLKKIPTQEDTRTQKSSQIYILGQHKCVFKKRNVYLYIWAGPLLVGWKVVTITVKTVQCYFTFDYLFSVPGH